MTRARHESRHERDARENGQPEGVEEEEDKVLLIHHRHAVVDPRAVVVEVNDAAAARARE